jgi:hypothetical protein
MKPGKPWSHTTELPVLAASAFKARDFVGRHLIEHGLSYLTDDVQLVVSELATNALIHAQTPFTVTLQALGRSVLLMVKDGSTAGPLYVAARDLDVGGRASGSRRPSAATGASPWMRRAASRCGRSSTPGRRTPPPTPPRSPTGLAPT